MKSLAMHSSFQLVCILSALCPVGFALYKLRVKANATCPVLRRCSCIVRGAGANVVCYGVSNAHEIDADMAMLEGVTLRKLKFRHVPLTKLPTKWVSNRTVLHLALRDCPLRDIGETAGSSLDQLMCIQLENTMLSSLPRSLTSAATLRAIYAKRNTFKALQGPLFFPELRKLDLQYNSIEEVNQDYLTSVPKLLHLVLSHNNIKHLSPLLFYKTRDLRKVSITTNRITAINGLFDNLRNLEIINLSFNKITDFSGLAKSTMPYLREINLSNNRIESITAFASTNVLITVIYLRENQIRVIEPGAFQALPRLRHLDLSKNRISSLNRSAFSGDSNLDCLLLSKNKLTSVTETFRNTRRIRVLKLSSNYITSITDAFQGLRTLRTLSVSDNLITDIPDDTFKDNSQLLELNMNQNKIQWLGRYAFRGLVTLTKIRLRSNRLLSLNGSVRHLLNLKFFDATFNKIHKLESGEFGRNTLLDFISLMGNNITNVEGAFTGVANLKGLALGGNRIELLRRSDFPVRMSTTPKLIVDNNPLLCDCRLAWLLREDSDVRLTLNPKCEKPHWLKRKPLRSLRTEKLDRWKDDCERPCNCSCREYLGNRTIVANCSSAALNRAPMLFPANTTELDISNNRLAELDEYLKKEAPDVEVLWLRNNRISSLRITTLPHRVHSIDVRGNSLAKLPHDLVLARNLTALWLSNNPFQCDWNDYPFRQWAEAHASVIRDAKHIICDSSSNALVSGRAFMTLRENELCPITSPAYVTYLLYLLGLVLVFLALSAAYTMGGRKLKSWLRIRGVCTWTHCIGEEDQDAEKLFDVFLSFSSKDGAWVHEQLLPGLEAVGLSCCTYERNFKGGFLLQDIIREAVASSRRTLLLLTRNFVASEWCRWEFRVAHQQALKDNINRLIIVVVDEVAPISLDEDLRLYMRSCNYLCWGEPSFWERLYSSMPKIDSEKKLITPQATAVYSSGNRRRSNQSEQTSECTV